MPSKSKVCFFFEKNSFTLNDRTYLKRFIEDIFKKEGKKLDSINYIFCSDKYLLEINRKYLDHDFYTDIITFDLSETKAITAEVYISIDRVRENSKNLNVPFKMELQRVMIHGALHLCGYNDKSKAQKRDMRVAEDTYLNRIKGST